MNKLVLSAVMIASLAGVVGCGSKQVGNKELEVAMSVAKDNASFNATKWLAKSPRYSNYPMEAQGDSSQNINCPQGDGWATVMIYNPENMREKVKLLCSTYSAAKSCLVDSDFKTKDYNQAANSCVSDGSVPYPFEKISK